LNFNREKRLPNIEAFFGSSRDLGEKKPESKRLYLAAGACLAILIAIGTWFTTTEWPPSTLEPVAQELEPPRRTSPPPLPEVQEKIDRMLMIAESHYSVGRIIEPAGSSALDAYQTILEIDSESEEAHRGMIKTLKYCQKQARDHLQKRHIKRSRELIDYCLPFSPNHPGLKQLRNRIEKSG
jgi:hypothetical protein